MNTSQGLSKLFNHNMLKSAQCLGSLLIILATLGMFHDDSVCQQSSTELTSICNNLQICQWKS